MPPLRKLKAQNSHGQTSGDFSTGGETDSSHAHPPLLNQAQEPLEGVELLVHLAKTGEIDPWNIDIVQVADQYLKAVADLKESELKITGKTLLFLAILLRMKSDQLAGIDYLYPPQDEFLDELLDADFMDDRKAMQPRISFRTLDEVIKRRTSTKQPRIRNVTLDDLIRELHMYEELEKRRSLKEKVEKVSHRRMMDYADFTADDIEEMAHEEFHEDTVIHLRDILGRILASQEEVSLTELMQAGRIDKISAYLALLFLTARGGFSLRQDEFYTELYVGPDQEKTATLDESDLHAGAESSVDPDARAAHNGASPNNQETLAE